MREKKGKIKNKTYFSFLLLSFQETNDIYITANVIKIKRVNEPRIKILFTLSTVI